MGNDDYQDDVRDLDSVGGQRLILEPGLETVLAWRAGCLANSTGSYLPPYRPPEDLEQ